MVVAGSMMTTTSESPNNSSSNGHTGQQELACIQEGQAAAAD